MAGELQVQRTTKDAHGSVDQLCRVAVVLGQRAGQLDEQVESVLRLAEAPVCEDGPRFDLA